MQFQFRVKKNQKKKSIIHFANLRRPTASCIAPSFLNIFKCSKNQHNGDSRTHILTYSMVACMITHRRGYRYTQRGTYLSQHVGSVFQSKKTTFTVRIAAISRHFRMPMGPTCRGHSYNCYNIRHECA